MWTLETDTNMKIFSPYTIICVLALTDTTLATSSTKSEATIVSERFHIKGLRDSDLTWFARRRDHAYDLMFLKSLARDVLIPNVFIENRVALANYCLSVIEALDFEDAKEIVHLLFDLHEYEEIIELYCCGRYDLFTSISEARLDDLYEAMKVSLERENFFEAMATGSNNTLSVPMYSRAILDFHLPKELYMPDLSSNIYLLTEVVRFVMSRVKSSDVNVEDVYRKTLEALEMHAINHKDSHDQSTIEFCDTVKKAIRMLISPENVTLKDLGITRKDLSKNAFDVMLVAWHLGKHSVMNDIFSMLNEEQLVDVLNCSARHAQYSESQRAISLPFHILGRLSEDQRNVLLTYSDSSTDIDLLNFLMEKAHVIGIQGDNSNVQILFYNKEVTDDIRLGKVWISSLYEDITTYKFNAPICLVQVEEWFKELKFASPHAFLEFLDLISRLSIVPELKSKGTVKVNIDSFIQIATDDRLIDKFAELELEPHFEINANDITKLFNEDKILNMTKIIPLNSIFKLINPAINTERMWSNFEKVGYHVFELLCYKIMNPEDNYFCEAKYLQIKPALIHVMKDKSYSERIRSLDNPDFQQMLARDFPQNEVTVEL